MAGYSYFSYDQMTLLGIEVHSDELELLQQAADMYDWEIMKTEVEPKWVRLCCSMVQPMFRTCCSNFLYLMEFAIAA